MSTPFLGELKIVSFNYAPRGWALSNGQLLPIQQNQALFSLLGTTYGGNGQTTFGLPNMQGRTPMHFGNGHQQGEAAGTYTQTLTITQIPQHNHLVSANANNTNATDSPGATTVLAGTSPSQLYSDGSGIAAVTVANGTIANAGGSQAHNNMMPYLTLNFCIALQGIFPSRN
jgi:microcystin-dependent protein